MSTSLHEPAGVSSIEDFERDHEEIKRDLDTKNLTASATQGWVIDTILIFRLGIIELIKNSFEVRMPALREEIREEFKAEMTALRSRIAELESRPALGYCGVWKAGEKYGRGDFVTADGSLWHCNSDGTKSKPGTDSTWTMAVKRGQDGKNANFTNKD